MGTRYQGTTEDIRALNAFIKLMRAAESLTYRLHKPLSEHGLTASQFGVLESLLHLGPLCQTELGRKLLKSTGNITMVIDNLERRGLVHRERDSNDRRFITVSLTEEGRELIELVFPERVAHIRNEMNILGADEQETLGRLCKQVGTQNREN
jgi:MarR family 2-MHQ and catechol resistance regulon transcriptional repressor